MERLFLLVAALPMLPLVVWWLVVKLGSLVNAAPATTLLDTYDGEWKRDLVDGRGEFGLGDRLRLV